jgi:NRPS condensation-like uncharacterized protein
MPATTPLNVLDELYLHLDRPDEPWSVHLEVWVEGRVDANRLAGAIDTASRRHPLARARLQPGHPASARYQWEVADRLAEVALREVECHSDSDLADARETLMGSTPSLTAAPPFAVTLAHREGGDAIMLNLAHAAGDGLAALRLMASFLRAYAGVDDPAPSVDPLAVRDIGKLVESRNPAARLSRGRTLLQQAGRLVGGPARVAPRGGDGGPGYGFELIALDPERVDALQELRTGGATLNDVLLGALAQAIWSWNRLHGSDDRSDIGLMMPVNLRPPEWRTEVVGNFASYVSVEIDAEDARELPSAVAAAAAATRAIKDQGAAGLVVDLLELPTATLPTALKQRFQDLIRLTGNRFVDTAVLSNLGRLESAPTLGADEGNVTRVWFSPPGRMPLGLSVGAATHEGVLGLTIRYRHELLGPETAADFGALFQEALEPSERAR